MTADDIEALAEGRHRDPFSVLGQHQHVDQNIFRTIAPGASKVELLDGDLVTVAQMHRIHEIGIYEAKLRTALSEYRLRIHHQANSRIVDDAYRFDSLMGEVDEHLLGEGNHDLLYDLLGAHPQTRNNASGVNFAVWAPNASRVSVVGDFNNWDGRCHPMRLHPANGIWDIFIPAVSEGDRYKYELIDSNGQKLPLKSDPVAFYSEHPPQTASVVYRSHYQWNDQQWQRNRSIGSGTDLNAAMTIYEIHTGSWRHADGKPLSYRGLADQLVPYLLDMGFTHVELMPVTAHPFDGSWGYQPIGLFAADPRQGEPDDLRYLIDQCHINGIGVIVDWVPAHFPKDDHGLRLFDGSSLYEHQDPRRGEHPDWGTHEFNLGRNEVKNYLTASALYWVREFHIDALRVDAVASLLYLDYSREPGSWVANESGGNEDLDAVAFLRHMNTRVHAAGAITIAEESTSWPMVSRPVEYGGLGFSLKWNMGWMNDTLVYMSEDPVHRRYHHDKLTFGLLYAFSENFVLPLSHDEVVHGKGALLDRMPGDDWQRFANLRAYLTYMYCHPGKKLLFMGNEFGQRSEWNHQQSLDWHLLEFEPHKGIQSLVRDLNKLIGRCPALYENDFNDQGFDWIEAADAPTSVLAFTRWNKGRTQPVVLIVNFTPVLREFYRVGVPIGGAWVECLNSDSAYYGGTDCGNAGVIYSDNIGQHGHPWSVAITAPPLGAVVITPADVNQR